MLISCQKKEMIILDNRTLYTFTYDHLVTFLGKVMNAPLRLKIMQCDIYCLSTEC